MLSLQLIDTFHVTVEVFVLPTKPSVNAPHILD
jgi:hypothetical protein